MKTIFTAVSLSLLAASGAYASGAAAPGVEGRTITLTDARDIRENAGPVVNLTVGTPKEVSINVLPPRDRVEAGYKADATVTLSTFEGAGDREVSRR